MHPFRGGIAQYTTMLQRELARHHDVVTFSFTRQYPSLFFPGKTQRDESSLALAVPATWCLDSIHPLSWWRTARLIEEQAPDLTVLMWWQPFFGPAFGTIAGHLVRRGHPCIFLCHNVVPHEASCLDRLLSWCALSRASGFVVHSKIDEEPVARFAPGRPVRVNPHPIYTQFGSVEGDDTERVQQARRKFGLTAARVLLFFGLIRSYKGLKVLLKAMASLRDDPDLVLVVAGECYEPEREYRSLIDQLGIGSRVVFTNRFIPNEEVQTYFTAADVLVLPYLSASQSGVIQIAYALGRPVIATRVGGLPEVVFPGQTGLLIPPGDVDALAMAVREFFRAGGRQAFAQGLASRRDFFSWSHLRATIEDLAELLHGH